MMQIDLLCEDCIEEAVKQGLDAAYGSSVPTPISHITDSGVYEVTCTRGHKSKVVIDNLPFEILFDYAINAIADGYFRDAIASFTSAMERYFEFFVKVIVRKNGSDFSSIDRSWKILSNQSERQLGAYVMLYTLEFNKQPTLLNTNTDTVLRNKVIHKGYVPTRDEAVKFGDAALNVIETSLLELKANRTAVNETFDFYSYKRAANNLNSVNIMTTVDVMHGREVNPNDGRQGNISQQIARVVDARGPRKLTFLKHKP
jgi:hypothetical protein